MVDVIKTLGFEYVAANPGSSYRGIHESLINYGGNKNPEFITCCHEESSVHMAQGYAQVEGKPMLVLAHSTVGLQHASMGIYDAWGGRTPVYIMIGNSLDATERRPGVEWFHSAQDAVAMVRDYTKWDDASHLSAAFRGVRRSRLQDLDDSSQRARGHRARQCFTRGSHPQRRPSAHTQAHPGWPSAGRFRLGQRTGQALGRGRESGPHRRRLRAFRRGHATPRRIRRSASDSGDRSRPELPLAASRSISWVAARSYRTRT